jgi:hypothetical protein
MRCLACGAEMQLREVVLADIPTMPGFEHHTFRCSACPQVARRLVICRAKMPIVDPPIPAHPEAPVIQREMGQACGPKRVAECGREAQQQTGGFRRTKGPKLGASGQEAQHGPQRPSSGSEGLGLGKDGREAPQQTAGSRGARGNCEDHRYGQRVQPDAKHARGSDDGFRDRISLPEIPHGPPGVDSKIALKPRRCCLTSPGVARLLQGATNSTP